MHGLSDRTPSVCACHLCGQGDEKTISAADCLSSAGSRHRSKRVFTITMLESAAELRERGEGAVRLRGVTDGAPAAAAVVAFLCQQRKKHETPATKKKRLMTRTFTDANGQHGLRGSTTPWQASRITHQQNPSQKKSAFLSFSPNSDHLNSPETIERQGPLPTGPWKRRARTTPWRPRKIRSQRQHHEI